MFASKLDTSWSCGQWSAMDCTTGFDIGRIAKYTVQYSPDTLFGISLQYLAQYSVQIFRTICSANIWLNNQCKCLAQYSVQIFSSIFSAIFSWIFSVIFSSILSKSYWQGCGLLCHIVIPAVNCNTTIELQYSHYSEFQYDLWIAIPQHWIAIDCNIGAEEGGGWEGRTQPAINLHACGHHNHSHLGEGIL